MKKRSDFESNRFFLACSLLIFYIGRNLVANPVCKVLKLLCLLHLFVQRLHCGNFVRKHKRQLLSIVDG